MDERELGKVRAAMAHARTVADQAWASAGRQEQKVERFRALLAETERGLTEAQAEANRLEQEAVAAEALYGEYHNGGNGNVVHVYADTAEVQGA